MPPGGARATFQRNLIELAGAAGHLLRLTLTFCMLRMFPQSSMYCLRSLSYMQEREREKDMWETMHFYSFCVLALVMEKVINNYVNMYFSICEQKNVWVMQDVEAVLLKVSPGTQTPVWVTCLCGRYRAASRCWHVSGPSVTTLEQNRAEKFLDVLTPPYECCRPGTFLVFRGLFTYSASCNSG